MEPTELDILINQGFQETLNDRLIPLHKKAQKKEWVSGDAPEEYSQIIYEQLIFGYFILVYLHTTKDLNEYVWEDIEAKFKLEDIEKNMDCRGIDITYLYDLYGFPNSKENTNTQPTFDELVDSRQEDELCRNYILTPIGPEENLEFYITSNDEPYETSEGDNYITSNV